MPTISQVYSVSDSREPNPWYISGNYLYFGQNYGGNPNYIGYIKKLDLSAGTETDITGGGYDHWAMWQAVYDRFNNRLIFVGEAYDANSILRAGITIVDLSNDTTSLFLHPNTGDCNELIGVVLDYNNNRIIAGERVYGGLTTGSNYPNGGGLWVIPLDTLTDTSTWSRVYEDPNYSEWISLAIFGNIVYASLFYSGTLSKISTASIDDLTTWTDLESSSRNDIQIHVDADDNMVAYTVVDVNGNVVLKYSSDGTTWNSITVASAPVNPGRTQLRVIGKYVVVYISDDTNGTADIYLVDTSAGTSTLLQSGISGVVAHGRGVYDGQQILYFGIKTGTVPSYIYSLTFDSKTVLSLNIDNPNPTAGSTITLTATLTDGINPISGAEIEFYIIYNVLNGHDATGELIGTATTDTNGQASIQYTIPTNMVGKVLFRALYKG